MEPFRALLRSPDGRFATTPESAAADPRRSPAAGERRRRLARRDAGTTCGRWSSALERRGLDRRRGHRDRPDRASGSASRSSTTSAYPRRSTRARRGARARPLPQPRVPRAKAARAGGTLDPVGAGAVRRWLRWAAAPAGAEFREQLEAAAAEPRPGRGEAAARRPSSSHPGSGATSPSCSTRGSASSRAARSAVRAGSRRHGSSPSPSVQRAVWSLPCAARGTAARRSRGCCAAGDQLKHLALALREQRPGCSRSGRTPSSRGDHRAAPAEVGGCSSPSGTDRTHRRRARDCAVMPPFAPSAARACAGKPRAAAGTAPHRSPRPRDVDHATCGSCRRVSSIASSAVCATGSARPSPDP